MNNKTTTPNKRMWRTLVRVNKKWDKEQSTKDHCVYLIIPAFSPDELVWCPRKAIPPYIYDEMEEGKRYYVECNIGAEDSRDICFNKWEDEEI